MSNYIVKSFFEIKSTDRNGIIFNDASKIVFSESTGHGAYDDKCVAQRDITATPPYFDFYQADGCIRVIFDKKGFFSKKTNLKFFYKLQKAICDYGYTTFDLS